MNILIAPYSKKLLSGKENPKNYPYWEELVNNLIANGHYITQVGSSGENKLNSKVIENPSLKMLETIVNENDLFISVDTFLPHFCNLLNKRGIVLWGPSDPIIFGYKQNINLLKDRLYLRPQQFETWEQWLHNPEAFVSSDVVMKEIILINSKDKV